MDLLKFYKNPLFSVCACVLERERDGGKVDFVFVCVCGCACEYEILWLQSRLGHFFRHTALRYHSVTANESAAYFSLHRVITNPNPTGALFLCPNPTGV